MNANKVYVVNSSGFSNLQD